MTYKVSSNGKKPTYNDHKFKCDRTGFEGLVSNGRHEWNGFFVLKEYWRERHPQDIILPIRDDSNDVKPIKWWDIPTNS